MSFHTIEFLIFFLPAVMFLYYVCNRFDQTEQRLVVKSLLIAVSVFFYAQLGLRGVCVLIVSIAVNYLLGLCIKRLSASRVLLILGLVFNIGLLVIFKTYAQGEMAPLGISFYTFSQIAYLVDIYKTRDRIGFVDYVLSIVFFAKIAEGPMMTPAEFTQRNTQQNTQRNTQQTGIRTAVNWKNLNRGLLLLAVGLAKKLFLADMIARFANAGFGMSSLTVVEAWVTSVAYSMELYFDFSGYCDMAVGIALLLQIELPVNFNSPYKALDFDDFWKRWHITLTSFLTRYLYFPLGGNRKGKLRTYINIMIVFAVSGIWHGIGLTFLLWGLLHGVSLVLCKLGKKQLAKIPKFFRWAGTFLLVNAYWVLFRAETIGEAIAVWKGMLKITTVRSFLTPEYMTRLKLIAYQNNKIALGVLVLSCLIAFCMPNAMQISEKSKRNVGVAILIAGILLAAIFTISTQNAASSLYFNF